MLQPFFEGFTPQWRGSFEFRLSVFLKLFTVLCSIQKLTKFNKKLALFSWTTQYVLYFINELYSICKMWTTELALTVILSWEHVVIKVKDPGNPVRRTDRREASVILISFIRKAPKNKGLISPKLHFYLRSFLLVTQILFFECIGFRLKWKNYTLRSRINVLVRLLFFFGFFSKKFIK